MIWPVIVVVSANTFYNICTKSTPEGVNAFASLFITYFAAALTSVVLFFVTGEQKNFVEELTKANWTSWILGFSVVALEFGYIAMYRAGWKVSTASLTANITLACVLLVVGILLYKERISFCQLLGAGICAVGLYLIGK